MILDLMEEKENFTVHRAVIEFSRPVKVQDSNRNLSWRPEKTLRSPKRKRIKAK